MTDALGSETEGNRRTMRDAFEAWQQGTSPITDVFAPDMRWRIEGHSAASRQYESTQQFIDEVLRARSAPASASGEPVPSGPASGAVYNAEDNSTVIVVWDGRGAATDGVATYHNTYAWFMTLKRAARSSTAPPSTTAFPFNELWERVQPR